MSLRLRLFLAVFLVIVVHTGVRIVLLAQDARDSARLAQQEQGEWVGKSLANTLANPLVSNDLATVQSTVELLFSEKTFLKLAVVDDRGRTIIDLRPAAGKNETGAPVWFTAFLDIVPEPSVQTIDIGGVVYGKIETIISPNSIVKYVWREGQAVAWVALAEVTILSLLLWSLMEVGLRPLKRLSMTVQRIGAGDFGAHMPAAGSREFSELIFVVNDMSQKLRVFYEERKQAEKNIGIEAQLRESQKMEAIGTLAGGIAHDFNNILATIIGNTELAREDAANNPQAIESLDEIHKAAARARGLVQQILSFSRRQPTEKKPLALGPVVKESTRLLRASLPARLKLKVTCETDVPLVLADATQIEQIVLNLVTNAMQAIRDGPGHITIQLDTVQLDAALASALPALQALHQKYPGRTVRLMVSDDGPGMDAATVARIFEPFFTTKAVDEGTGLGLSVVLGIVQTHGGAIVVDSHLSKGSTFTIYLPVVEGQAPAASPPTPAATPPTSPKQGRRILYLDDDEALVSLVKRLLERRGLCIDAFVNQDDALSALLADPNSFDLMVTDYNMPGMSGLEVARAVRAIRADLPVVIASGFIDDTLRTEAAGAGVRELIFKASTVEDLCDAFVRLVEKAPAAS